MTAPIAPLLFRRGEGVETGAVHIAKAVGLDKISEILLEAGAIVGKTGGSG